jgi:choline-sulfatase
MAAKPNILIIMPDQMRADCMGCAGHPQIRTANLDRLAAEGTRFANAATTAPLCMPARASVISGLYPHNTGLWRNAGQLPADDETFFHHLQRAGYHTAHVGKSHYYSHRSWPGRRHLREAEGYMHARGLETVHETTGPWATVGMPSYMTDAWAAKGLYETFRQDYADRARHRREHGGVDVVRPSPLPVEDYLDSYVGGQAVRFLSEYDEQCPWCLFVGFPGPHEPFDAPGRYATMYDPADTPPAVGPPQDLDALPEAIRGRQEFQAVAGLDPDTIAAIRANYYGKITLIDEWVGRMLDACRRRGWLDELVVIVWSDHGEMAGDHGRLYKSTFYEASLRVPLLVRWPGRVPAGKTSDALAEVADVFPTCLAAAGCEPSPRALGRSLLDAGDGGALRDAQLSEVANASGLSFMAATRRHKYAADQAGRGFMLFDLDDDPHELHNLIADPAAAPLRDRMHRLLADRLLEAQYTM